MTAGRPATAHCTETLKCIVGDKNYHAVDCPGNCDRWNWDPQPPTELVTHRSNAQASEPNTEGAHLTDVYYTDLQGRIMRPSEE